MNINGPGQNASASFSAVALNWTTFLAISMSLHTSGSGFSALPLISHTLMVASGSLGMQPIPYTVSVG